MPFVLLTISLMVGGATYVETRALDRLDHPKPKKVSCISCHTDKATLRAMEDKAGDSLYLVHTGDLTAEQLKELESPSPKKHR